MDVIRSTATMPITVPPRAHSVADAWLSQSGGYERYFLENVRHGIRTFDDGEIWQRIEKRAPHWLTSEDYAQAIKALRAEAAGNVDRKSTRLNSSHSCASRMPSST